MPVVVTQSATFRDLMTRIAGQEDCPFAWVHLTHRKRPLGPADTPASAGLPLRCQFGEFQLSSVDC